MPNYKSHQAEKMFEKLKIENGSSNHHIRGFLIDDTGKKLFPPLFFSKGNKELPKRVENNLRKSLKLKAEEFNKLITCHMSRPEYMKLRKLYDS